MTEINITSLSQLRSHVQGVIVPGWDDPEPVWTCPECGAVNIGAFFHGEMPCNECHKFWYPKKGCVVKSNDALKEIKKLESIIERYYNEIDDLENEIGECQHKMRDAEAQLKKLRCSKG